MGSGQKLPMVVETQPIPNPADIYHLTSLLSPLALPLPAGLLSAGRWGGKQTPQKGRGLPPQENADSIGPYGVRNITHLLSISQRDPIGVNGYKGLGSDGALQTKKKKKAKETRANATHVFGAVVKLEDMAELNQTRKLRGAGRPPTALSVNTAHRVMGTEQGLSGDDVNPGLAACRRTAYGELRRPSTARADLYRGTVGDLLRQEGISPPAAPPSNIKKQLCSPAKPSPQEERIRAGGQAVWSDAHAGAAANRARGSAGTVVFG